CDVATLPRPGDGLRCAQDARAGGHAIAAFAPLVRASTRCKGGRGNQARRLRRGRRAGRARPAHSEREHTMAKSGWLARGAARAAAGVVVAFGLQTAICGAALAQQDKAQPKQQQSAWVKLCEKAQLAHRDKEGKQVRERKSGGQ